MPIPDEYRACLEAEGPKHTISALKRKGRRECAEVAQRLREEALIRIALELHRRHSVFPDPDFDGALAAVKA